MSMILSRSEAASVPLAPLDLHERVPRLHQAEGQQFKRLVAVSLVFFLVLATLARLTRWKYEPWPQPVAGSRSLLQEAREAAESYIALSFLGW